MYLPRSLAVELEKVNRSGKDLDFQQYADTVFVLDRKGYDLLPENHELPGHVAVKKTLLEDNLFLLLKKRDSYLPTTFVYLFEKYCKQFSFYLWLMEWLDDNLKTYITDADDYTERAFREQRHIFQKHKEELSRNFRQEIFKIGELQRIQFGLDVGNNTEVPKDLEEIKRFMLPKTEEERTKKIKTKKEKIAELKEFTKGYADELILERVFNMKRVKNKRGNV